MSAKDIVRQLGLDTATGIIRTVSDVHGQPLDGRNPRYGLPWTANPRLWYSGTDGLPNPTFTPHYPTLDGQVTPGQAETVRRASQLVDERRGIPFTAGPEARPHTFSVIQKESKELTTVFVWGQPSEWVQDSDIARIVMDRDGRLHQLHHGLADGYGAVWVDLDPT